MQVRPKASAAPVTVRAEVRPPWPFQLRGRSPDGLWRRRGDAIQRLVHVGDEAVFTGAIQRGDRVVFAARAPSPGAAAEGLRRLRFAVGVDEDHRGFCERFRGDRFIGRAVRALPELRVRRCPDPWEALAWAICEQLIEFDRAVTIERRLIIPPKLSSAEVQGAVGDAVTGYVHPDLIVEIATALGLLPVRTVAVEVEPEVVTTGDGLTPCLAAVMDDLLETVRIEARRAPLVALANEMRPLLEGDRLEESGPTAAARELLDELMILDKEGRWGRTFSLRDRLQLSIASSDSSEGMNHQDWALWWTLIEEIGRLEVAETVRRK